MIGQLLFVLALAAGAGLFAKQIVRLRKGLGLARKTDRHDQKSERWKTMARVALGQGKMGARPLAAFFHIIVYVGFVLINLEVLEILLDGITGQHRILQAPLGGLYTAAINFFEILGVLVIVACVVFLLRRWFGGIARFTHSDLTGWPQQDAAIILYTEIVLMAALLIMNAAEAALPDGHAPFLVAQALAPLFAGLSPETLHLWMEGAWWFHFIGILAFLNYLPMSKHFHIILAFPNTWYSKLSARGRIPAMSSVTREIKAMLDPSYVPDSAEVPARFGAKDIEDLHFVNVLNAYSCTECGRCTSECPANQTGKLLSPRKIMMATRDRVEQLLTTPDNSDTLLDHWISREELWACTTCNACVEACPLNIDPLDIIQQMRQYLVMEESAAPASLNTMMNNVENNGAPWAYPQADRALWTTEN